MYHLGARIVLISVFVVVQMQCISMIFHYYNQNALRKHIRIMTEDWRSLRFDMAWSNLDEMHHNSLQFKLDWGTTVTKADLIS